MDLKNANVLITGGSDGIGKALTARFLETGCTVMVTGRNENKLKQAQKELPGLLICVNDISDPLQREELAHHVKQFMPGLNILVNNAGIQRRIGLAADQAAWAERQQEINTLLSGPIHLNHLLIPTLIAGNQNALIVNVTSGGAYIPQVFAPVYSACKAALHHYTLTLRHSLSATNCRVAELIPPAVQTAMAGLGVQHGVPVNDFIDQVFTELFDQDHQQVGFGPTADLNVEINGQSQTTLFLNSVSRFPVDQYSV